MGVRFSLRGVSWLAVEVMTSLRLESRESQAQPLPKRVAAAALNSSWNFSKLPKVVSISVFSSGEGVVGVGLRIFQKREWLWCPPPLLRTAVRMFSGMV